MKTLKIIFFPITLIAIFLVKIYKWCISPLIPHCCRFTPSCSTYMIQSLKEYGLFYGLVLGIKRILRCSPGHKGGYDPVKANIKGDFKWII